jgi:hypothetical protein
MFYNEVASGHASKKHDSCCQGKQQVAKEKYTKIVTAEKKRSKQ